MTVPKHQWTGEAEEFLVTLRALPSAVPPSIRLRQFLKRALRAYDLRCVRIEDVVRLDAAAQPVAAAGKCEETVQEPATASDAVDAKQGGLLGTPRERAK